MITCRDSECGKLFVVIGERGRERLEGVLHGDGSLDQRLLPQRQIGGRGTRGRGRLGGGGGLGGGRG